MRLCSELSQAESNPRHCKAEVGLSMLSRQAREASEEDGLEPGTSGVRAADQGGEPHMNAAPQVPGPGPIVLSPSLSK